MIRILSVIGTRPEAIKMAPVVAELAGRRTEVESLVCVTGQHRVMLDQVLELFDIRPDFDLDLMTPDQALSALTAGLFAGLGPVVEQTKPDWVLAEGDTATVLVAALVAFYNRVPFGHVEAGLRTGDWRRPFPEEMNRRVADMAARVFFAPTERSREALLKEGACDEDIYVTGNTVVDALRHVAARSDEDCSEPVAGLPPDAEVVLVTAHRRESFSSGLREICLAVRELASTFESSGVRFVYPVHPNPNVRRPVSELLSGLPNVALLDPLDYLSMVRLMKRSVLILTDSGGIQEEAPSLGVPVLVMRDETERPEGIEAGVARLVGTQSGPIVEEATRLLKDPGERAKMATAVNPYGDGHAAERIVTILLERSA